MNFGVFAFQALPDTSSRGEAAQPAPSPGGEPASAPPSGFGLITPLLILIPFILILFLQGRSQHMLEEINESSVAVLNLIVANRDKMKLPATVAAEE